MKIFGIPIGMSHYEKGGGIFYEQGSVTYATHDGKQYRVHAHGNNVKDQLIDMYRPQEVDLENAETQEVFWDRNLHHDNNHPKKTRRSRS